MRTFARSFVALSLLVTAAAVATAQVGCASGRRVPDLGYGFASCHNCLTLELKNGNYVTRFTGEPALYQIRADGPAAGKLVDGDTLVSIDGVAIATEEATMKLSRYIPGPMKVTVRRKGVLRTETITPWAVCVGSSDAGADSLSRRVAIQAPIVYRKADSGFRARFDSGFRTKVDSGFSRKVVAKPLVSFPLTYRKADPVISRDWTIGFGIACDSCTTTRTPTGGLRWEFRGYPVIASVLENSPAWRTGLRSGDTLYTIDGLTLNATPGRDKLAAVVPGTSAMLTWHRAGAAMSGRLQFAPFRGPVTVKWKTFTKIDTVGNAIVSVTGPSEKLTVVRSAAGVVTIKVDSVIVTVKPPV